MDNLSKEVGLIIIFSVFLVIVGVGIIILVLIYQKKQLQYLREKEQLKIFFETELLKTQLEIQEQTLKTISQEIHDNIGQVLSLAKLNLNTVDLANQDETREKITDSKKLVTKAIQDLRDLSRSMNTDSIEAIGLIKAIEYELEMIRKTGFKTELNVEGSVIRSEPQKELILFRIIQEVLNNIMKHAEATSIETKLVYAERQIKIEVKDNGKGFDLNPLNESNNSGFGLGIRNMNNRAKLIGADFSMSSSIGEGTTVSLTVPLINHNL